MAEKAAAGDMNQPLWWVIHEETCAGPSRAGAHVQPILGP